MTIERDECRVAIDGVAPSVVRLMRNATRIATDEGRTWVEVHDVLAALVSGEEAPLWWPRTDKPRIDPGIRGGIPHSAWEGDTVPLSYKEFRELVHQWVSGTGHPDTGPDVPPAVTYELSGRHAEEFRRMIERP